MSYFGKTNVVLVGMPGAGKSTIGVLLAKHLSLDFFDVDVHIQRREGRLLQNLIDQDGIEAFKQLEEKYLLTNAKRDTVISTGGSAIYAERGITHLKRRSVIIFLKISMETLTERLGDFSRRGVIMRADQSFEDLFIERGRLYHEAADITIECDGKTQEEIVAEISNGLLN